MVVKLYEDVGSPPSFTVKACLAYLKVPYESVIVSLEKMEHLTADFKKKNPNGELPCLEDDGFYVSESAAIIQYLADRFKKDDTLYPSNLQQRARINHLLAFNNTSYYKGIFDMWFYPAFYAYPKLQFNTKKMKHYVGVFDNILGQYGGPYAIGTNKVTIADIHLLMTQICLDAYEFDISSFPNVTKWYKHVQKNETEIWKLGDELRSALKPFVGPLDPAILPKTHAFQPCNPSEYV